MTPDEAGLAFLTPAAYADEAYFHHACAVLRREDPIHLVEGEGFAPFHVITKHADVYPDPFTFDVGRQPNKHLAFGFGVHYCLGAMLARMELRALLNELLPRLESIELTAEPRYMQTLFVGGPKTVPIRYTLRETVGSRS